VPGLSIDAPRWTVALDDHVEALAWTGDGSRLVAGSLGGDAVVADAGGAVVAKLATHPLGVLCAAWSPDGERLAVGGQDGVLRLADGVGEELAVHEHRGWVTCVGWSPDGTTLAGGIDRTLLLVDADGATQRVYEPAPSTITAVAWSPDGRRVGATAYGGLRWYKPTLQSTEPMRTWAWKGSLLSLAVQPGGRWACAGSQDATVHLWRLWSGKELSMGGYPAKIEHLAFRADGRWMANACLGELTVWDFSSSPAGTVPAHGSAHDRHITALAWQPDGTLLATGAADGRLVLWPSPDSGATELMPVAVHDDEVGVARLAWTPDGRSLAVGRADGRVELREVES
jgi:WD40 repeat protein